MAFFWENQRTRRISTKEELSLMWENIEILQIIT